MNYFVNDIRISFSLPDQWFFLAYHDIRSRYRRTKLGPIWIVLVNLVTILCFSVVSASLFKQDVRAILPHVAAGLFVWSYIATILSDSCVLFTSHAHLLQNMRTNLISLCLRLFIRNTLAFLHAFPLLILIALLYSPNFSWKILLLLPSFILFALTSVSTSIILGFLTARFRDVGQIVQSIVTIFPFITPILWSAQMLGDRAYLATINPVTHFIALIRDPLLGNPPLLNTYLIAAGTSFSLLVFAIFLYNKFRYRLIFWL